MNQRIDLVIIGIISCTILVSEYMLDNIYAMHVCLLQIISHLIG